ncbi:MAG: SPOR domain-containing protein [Acidiferrobacter sp.]
MPVGVIVVITLLIGAGLGILTYRLLQRPTSSPAPAVTPVKPQVPPLAPPVPTPQGPAPGLPAATQFDFYTILPEIHHRHHGVFPHAHATQAPRAPTAAAVVITNHYILQAASFPDPADANRLLATLALHGVSAYIERVSIAGRGAFYRVRLGPLRHRQLAHDRHILATLGLQPIVLREARGN